MTGPTYTVTDLHPTPIRDRWLTWGRVGRVLLVVMIALAIVIRFCARHLGRFLVIRVRGDGMPLWWALLWTVIFGRIIFGIIATEAAEHPCAGARIECPHR